MDVKAAPNGVATIEDRILRITGYYGYYPGYSSQKSKTPLALPGSRRRRGWSIIDVFAVIFNQKPWKLLDAFLIDLPFAMVPGTRALSFGDWRLDGAEKK
ncbi:hypothetical protein JEQ12_018322 [Ovis aries]|uniref:Uncharacterized protein n=1 Tax=Ovis aries TaxID=9940 RepID=A0A836AES9_SHEEP|nr:hypothetical protein JEQ12_018322 [Ovis aries]